MMITDTLLIKVNYHVDSYATVLKEILLSKALVIVDITAGHRIMNENGGKFIMQFSYTKRSNVSELAI